MYPEDICSTDLLLLLQSDDNFCVVEFNQKCHGLEENDSKSLILNENGVDLRMEVNKIHSCKCGHGRPGLSNICSSDRCDCLKNGEVFN